MKKNIFSFFILASLVVACSGNKEKKEANWPELESFHKIMAKVFHPLKDSNNLAPAKMLIGDLATQAATWSAASLPKEVDTPEMKSMLEDLKNDSQLLADTVKNGAADSLVSKNVSAIHRQFHKIMEAWERSHHEGDHNEDEKHEHEEED
ncbi:MAG: hypothetical protein QM734_16550 [Cyclobacteriaceae bacterium]